MSEVTGPSERTSSKGGRPTRLQKQAIDSAILDAARSCFLSRGFEQTTIEWIASAARVSKATIYVRYPNKVAILRAVLQERLRTWGEETANTDWMLGDTLERRLVHYGRVILAQSRNREVRSFLKLMRSSWGGAQDVAAEMLVFLQAPMLDQLTRDIRMFSRTNDLSPDDAQFVARLFLGMLGVIDREHQTTMPIEQDFIDAKVRQAVAVLMLGQAAWPSSAQASA